MSCVSPLHIFFDSALKHTLLKVFSVSTKDNIYSVSYSSVFECSFVHLDLAAKFNRLLTLQLKIFHLVFAFLGLFLGFFGVLFCFLLFFFFKTI